MTDFYGLSYGDILRELRIYHGYKQKQLSDYLNITSQAYSNYEHNKRVPDTDTLYKIAQFYHISMDELISYRFTRQLEDIGGYIAPKTLYRAVCDTGISIPMSAATAKTAADLESLPQIERDLLQQIVAFMKSKAE